MYTIMENRIFYLAFFFYLAYYYTRNGITTTDGVYISIGDKDLPPDISSNYIRARPHVVTDVRISQTVITRQPAPYTSQCIDKYPEKFNSLPKGLFNYSESFCQTNCRASIINETCGCWVSYFVAPYVSS